MGLCDRLSDPHGTNLRRQEAGIYSAVGCPRRQHARRLDQPPHARRRDRDDRTWALLRRRCAGDEIGREYHQWYGGPRSEEHTSELQSLMRLSYAVFCLKKKKKK